MNGVIQLLVLAGIALFLILRLRSVLGTREGFEKPPVPRPVEERRSGFEVIDGGPDMDIIDHVEDGSDSAKALAAFKMAEPGLSVNEFLGGAKGAYEMILMAFENGDLSEIEDFISQDIHDAFVDVIGAREDQGLRVEANFVGVRETTLKEATFNRETKEAEITVKFVGEMTSVVKDAEDNIVEGDATSIKRQRDVWTFARTAGSDTPNWTLVATGE